MTLRNVSFVRAQDIDEEQRKPWGIEVDRGLVAIETHNEKYKQKAVVLKKGLVNYILNGE